MKKTIWIAVMMAGVLMAQARSGVKSGARSGGAFGPLTGNEFEKAVEAETILLRGQAFNLVSGIGRLIENAPYAAEAVTETTQRLFDGNQIVRKSTVKQYRDSAGRERREESAGVIQITDPVAKLRLTLNPETKTAQQQAFGGGTTVFISKGPSVPVVVGGRGAPPNLTAVRVGGAFKEENLGTRLIEGVQAQGTRVTSTIPTGEIGNTRPIETVDEHWYSPDLQMTVMSRHTDPREGETVYRLTNIQRIEQVRSLFEVPSDYNMRPVAGARGVRLKSK